MCIKNILQVIKVYNLQLDTLKVDKPFVVGNEFLQPSSGLDSLVGWILRGTISTYIHVHFTCLLALRMHKSWNIWKHERTHPQRVKLSQNHSNTIPVNIYKLLLVFSLSAQAICLGRMWYILIRQKLDPNWYNIKRISQFVYTGFRAFGGVSRRSQQIHIPPCFTIPQDAVFKHFLKSVDV